MTALAKQLELLIACGVLAIFLGSPATARAESDGERSRLTAELDRLAAGDGADMVSAELGQARELLRLAAEARAAGQTATAQTLLSLVPLQLQLIREILGAVQSETEAAAAERRLHELTQERRVAREALEQVLERLLALSAVAGGRP